MFTNISVLAAKICITAIYGDVKVMLCSEREVFCNQFIYSVANSSFLKLEALSILVIDARDMPTMRSAGLFNEKQQRWAGNTLTTIEKVSHRD